MKNYVQKFVLSSSFLFHFLKGTKAFAFVPFNCDLYRGIVMRPYKRVLIKLSGGDLPIKPEIALTPND